MKRALLVGLVLCASASATTQEPPSALVRIVATRGGTPVRGTGFVVAADKGYVTVVTAAHVIQGAQVEVSFAGQPLETHAVAPRDILHVEDDSRDGLAAFVVRGNVSNVTALELDEGPSPSGGDQVLLVGYPQQATSPRTLQRTFAAREGLKYVLDQPVGEGFSGGPVLRGTRAIAMITSKDDQFTYAVPSRIVREFVLGSGGRLSPTVAPANRPPAVGKIVTAPSGIGIESVTNFTFTAVDTVDPDGDALNYHWQSSDGAVIQTSGESVTYVFTKAGAFTMTARVTDAKGASTSASVPVRVGNLTGTWDVYVPAGPKYPSRYVVTITQSGARLSGTIMPFGSNRPTPISVAGEAKHPRSVYFGSESPWWSDMDDAYFDLVVDDQLYSMSGKCSASWKSSVCTGVGGIHAQRR